jgi:hypothetical protein
LWSSTLLTHVGRGVRKRKATDHFLGKCELINRETVCSLLQPNEKEPTLWGHAKVFHKLVLAKRFQTPNLDYSWIWSRFMICIEIIDAPLCKHIGKCSTFGRLSTSCFDSMTVD